MKQISKKHQAFADEYMINGFCAKAAYSKTYPKCSDATAETNGPELLRNTQIQDYINKLQAENRAKYDVTKEEIIEVTKRIMLTQEKIFPPASLKAAEILNKMFGYNASEKHDVNINPEQPLFPTNE